MKIEGLPVIDVDESEKITVAVGADAFQMASVRVIEQFSLTKMWGACREFYTNDI